MMDFILQNLYDKNGLEKTRINQNLKLARLIT